MKKRDMKTSRPRILSQALVLSQALALSMPALIGATSLVHAQAGDQQMLKEKDEYDNKAAQQYIDRTQTDEKYHDAIKGQASAPTSNDPWGTVRPTTAPAKPAAKPAVKPVASAAKPAAGTNKPAVNPAAGPAAANGATPKTQ